MFGGVGWDCLGNFRDTFSGTHDVEHNAPWVLFDVGNCSWTHREESCLQIINYQKQNRKRC